MSAERPEDVTSEETLETTEDPTADDPYASLQVGVKQYLEGIGTIVAVGVEEELTDSFMEYAMSVIVSRAIPDVRDGLKPVQRRILYSMWEQGLRSDKPHQKSAKVVGAVMGNYHPHGDAAIYDAMVRLAQDWIMAVPLVDGQGNFGSPDDSPASSRYTEARLAPAADALVGDLGEETVDYIPNYAGNTVQPVVLPAKYPNLLVNGGAGIAVGMATNLVPHNLGEVAKAVRMLIENPKATTTELMKAVPGPDFPTGGLLIETEGLREAYTTGRGTIRVRGRVELEETAKGRGGKKATQIVVKELPYGVGPERFITKTVEAITAKKVDGVTGISDHSDRYAGQRIVLELRPGVNPQAVLSQLYAHTPLEDRISVNQVALVGGAPQVLGMKKILELWIEFAVEVITRRTAYRLRRAEERLHLVTGLVKALDAIDAVVDALKRSQTTQTAREKIMKLISVDEVQANYILEMPLRRLTSLERGKLRDEEKELRKTVTELGKLAASRKLQEEVVLEELDEVVAAAGGPRRTTIISATQADEGIASAESVEIADEECEVTLTRTGLIGRELGGRRREGADDVLTARVRARTRSDLLIVSRDGVALRRQGFEIAPAEGASRGEKTTQLGVKNPVGLISQAEIEAGGIPVIITRRGVVKRVNPQDLSQMPEVSLIRLDGGDEVVWAGVGADTADIFFVTSNGQVLRTPAGKIRPQGRNAGGVAGINLEEGAEVIAGGIIEGDAGLVAVVTDGGRVKASPASEYPAKGRATGGVRTIRFLKGEERLIGAAVLGARRWTWVDAKGAPIGATEPAKRDASGEVLDGDAVGAGELR